MITDAQVEAAANAMFESNPAFTSSEGGKRWTWQMLPNASKNYWRGLARAALAAAQAGATKWKPGDPRCDECDNGIEDATWEFCPWCFRPLRPPAETAESEVMPNALAREGCQRQSIRETERVATPLPASEPAGAPISDDLARISTEQLTSDDRRALDEAGYARTQDDAVLYDPFGAVMGSEYPVPQPAGPSEDNLKTEIRVAIADVWSQGPEAIIEAIAPLIGASKSAGPSKAFEIRRAIIFILTDMLTTGAWHEPTLKRAREIIASGQPGLLALLRRRTS